MSNWEQMGADFKQLTQNYRKNHQHFPHLPFVPYIFASPRGGVESSYLIYWRLPGSLEGSKYMGVSKNRGAPKWMVYNGNPIEMDDLGGFPPIFGSTPI